MPLAKYRCGFTLIELLVVIVVISIVAAILFPVFASAREKGHQAVCQSNLRQIGLACMQYSQDCDELVVPQGMSVDGNPSHIIYWPTLIFPYIHGASSNATEGIFWCPAAGDTAAYFKPDRAYIDPDAGSEKSLYCGVTPGDGSYNVPGAVYLKPGRLCYARNTIYSSNWTTPGWANKGRFGYNPTTSAIGASVSEAQVEDPAGTIHIFDAIVGADYLTPTPTSNPCTSGAAAMVRIISEASTDRFHDAETTKPAYRHSGGFDALYGDGHVKFRKWGATTPCEWSIQADPYPSDPPAMASACRGR
jgi:prepilin-type N-terminal cleavage/methylation domain-containing protein/prepilin-type processing-associated H-X9-DG protein